MITAINHLTQLISQTNLGDGINGIGVFMDRQKASTGAGLGRLVENIGSTIFTFLTTLAGLAFLLYFVLGAIAWITSGGDAQKIEGAKNQMTSAAIGLIAVIAAYTVAGIVSMVLGIDILNPAAAINSIRGGEGP